jgi:hypothetical protein
MPRFQPGESGNLAGRPAGSKNKFKYEVAKTLEELQCDPFEVLIYLALHSESERIKCQAASELAQYIAPKLKSIELKGDQESPFSFTINLAGNK